MSDILLKQTPDGGECVIANGQLLMSEGLETAAYLSLFGSNSDDSGLSADDAIEWWANKIEPDPARKQRGQFQNLLATRPLTPANLQLFEEAAAADLAWFEDEIADSVAVVATMPGINTVLLAVAFVINGKTTAFKLTPPSNTR